MIRAVLDTSAVISAVFWPRPPKEGASQFPAALLLSLAPGFSRVIERPDGFNRFSGLQAPKNR